MNRILPPLVTWLGFVVLATLGGTACRKATPAGTTGPTAAAAGSPGGPVAPPAAPVRPPLPTGWREFKHPEGVFQIYLPGPALRPPQAGASLFLKRPLQPLESRDSVHQVLPTETQPLTCQLEVHVFHPSARPAYDRFDAKPRIVPNGWVVTSDRPVTWGGRPATEIVIEKTLPTQPPRRSFSVGRYILSPERLYQFAIEREGRMPDPAQVAVFFDSFVPGD